MKTELITSPEKLRNQQTRRQGFQGNFQPPYIVEPLHAEYRAGRKYELVKRFVCLSAIVGLITVPEGYITDFHSIPRWLWPFLPPDDWAEPAVPHDLICQTHRVDDRMVTWQEAHMVHREFLLHVGCPEFRANVMYYSLKEFGPRW